MAARWVRPQRPVRLSFPLTLKKKIKQNKKRKEGLEKKFGHAVKSPGLIKMISFRENAFGTA